MRPLVVAWLTRHLGPTLGELLAPDYMTMICLAFVVCGALTLRLGRLHGLDMQRGLLALLGVYVGGLVGARVFTALVHLPAAIATRDPALVLAGGLTAYGGLLGGALAGYLVLPRGTFFAMADASAPALGLGIAVVRVGCLLGGCDFGAPSAAAWAIRYPAGSLAYEAHARTGWLGAYSTESLAVHPTPLYEATLGLVIAGASLLLLWRRRRRGAPLDGRVFLTAALLYAVGRFGVEHYRGDLDRGIFWGGLSTSQLTSIAVLTAVAALTLRRSRQPT